MAVELRMSLVILAVRDLSRSVDFYRKAFGWSQTVDESVYAEFELPGGEKLGLYERVAFARNTGQVPVQPPDGELTGTEIYFHTEEIVTAIGRLDDVGARKLGGLAPRTWGDEAAYYADPDGNVLVLARPLEQP